MSSACGGTWPSSIGSGSPGCCIEAKKGTRLVSGPPLAIGKGGPETRRVPFFVLAQHQDRPALNLIASGLRIGTRFRLGITVQIHGTGPELVGAGSEPL